MTNVTPAAGRPAADLSMRSPASSGGGWAAPVGERTLERERLEDRARRADATAQLQRCFPRWSRALEHLTARGLERLARNEPVDPNDPEIWRSRDAHAQAVLHRHGLGKASAPRLTSSAITALVDAQAQADRDAGLDWSSVTVPARVLDGRLARAHERLPIALEDPTVWAYPLDQRRALAGRLGFNERRADDLSRWVLAHPGEFDAADLRCWRIGSDSWLALAGEQLAPVEKVERPVGLFVVPALSTRDGWQLMPVLALETIRLVVELGGRLDRDLRSAVVPIASREELLERINIHTLHAGPRECLDAAGQLAQELSRQLGVPVSPGVPHDKRDRWGRIALHRRSYKGADGTTTARARAAGADVSGARVQSAAAGVGAARAAVLAPERGDGPRRGGADGDRRRAAAAALDGGRRRAEGHRPGRADEGPPRNAHDHQLRRRVRDHAAGRRRAGDRLADRAEALEGEGDAVGRRPAARANDDGATARR